MKGEWKREEEKQEMKTTSENAATRAESAVGLWKDPIIVIVKHFVDLLLTVGAVRENVGLPHRYFSRVF